MTTNEYLTSGVGGDRLRASEPSSHLALFFSEFARNSLGLDWNGNSPLSLSILCVELMMIMITNNNLLPIEIVVDINEL